MKKWIVKLYNHEDPVIVLGENKLEAARNACKEVFMPIVKPDSVLKYVDLIIPIIL